ncbi:glycosyltransferase family 4 protein [Flavobacterium chuncheonense]|uniref:Glycosyltransferase family 4 protein n=1 Tax=Flavobacterium chuncheonense TaxID=2026653 RepID=A0ABW5YJ12_9FLAO
MELGKKKRIAVICDYRLLPERVGGMDRFFWRYDERAKELGHTVDWFFPNKGTHGDYQKLKITAAKETSLENCFIKQLVKDNSEYDYIVTHFIELCTPFFKQIKKALPLAKVIVVDHNPRPIGGYPFKKRWQKRIKGWWYSRYIDSFVGVSKYTVSELLNDFGNQIQKKCEVIYNGIDTAQYKRQKERRQIYPTFVVASHLRFSKGIQDLVAAIALWPIEQRENLKIDIYGDGPQRVELEKQIQEQQLEANIHVKGSVANLNETYAQYDYMIQPTHMECFSLSILESLCANVPVITTPVGGNEEVVQHEVNGFIVPVADSKELSRLIGLVYKGDLKITKEVAETIRKDFDIETMVDNHIKQIGSR